jgi:hypothetical protein
MEARCCLEIDLRYTTNMSQFNDNDAFIFIEEVPSNSETKRIRFSSSQTIRELKMAIAVVCGEPEAWCDFRVASVEKVLEGRSLFNLPCVDAHILQTMRQLYRAMESKRSAIRRVIDPAAWALTVSRETRYIFVGRASSATIHPTIHLPTARKKTSLA